MNLHRLGLLLRQALRGENVLHLGGSNAKSQRAERPMRAGVTVSANDRHSRLCQAQFRPNHVDDSLIRRIHIKQAHAKLFAVGLQGRNLPGGNQVGNGGAARLGRNVVIHGGHGPQGLAYFSSGDSQAIKSLRRRHLMHQMKVDIENWRAVAGLRDQVRIPNLPK